MKIVHVCLYGPVTDGWNYQDNMLPKFQVKDGHDVTLVASKWVFNDKGKIEYLDKTNYDYNGIHMVRLDLKIGRDIYSKIKVYSGLYEVLESIKPDCLFIHGSQFVDIHTIVKYVRKYKPKVYIDNHCDFYNSAKNWLSKNILHEVIWKWFAKEIEPYATKFYGVLPARVDFLTDVYKLPKEKCELLVMGADDDEVVRVKTSNIRPTIRNKYSISDNEILLLTGGKIDNNKKEIITLMNAFSRANLSNTKLMVFGSISPNLKQEFDKALGNNIIYVGWIDSTQIYDYMESSDIIVFPGLHSVLWEQAVGMGKACIFRKITGFDHVDLGGNCAYFESVEMDQIMNAAIHCIENNTWKKMQSIAEQKGMSYFSYEKIARRCINELEEK